jgi:hypothetical protein
MKYDDRPDIDSAYRLIASLYESDDDPGRAMTTAETLLERGEARSWASVWWAYGAVHHDLSDEAYAKALDLLAHVQRPDAARAAALMLRAEIESTQAIDAGGSPDARRQAELLSEAVALAPEWPSLRLRLAYPLRDLGQLNASREEACRALELLERAATTGDPFESAISGTALDLDYVAREVESLRDSNIGPKP